MDYLLNRRKSQALEEKKCETEWYSAPGRNEHLESSLHVSLIATFCISVACSPRFAIYLQMVPVFFFCNGRLILSLEQTSLFKLFSQYLSKERKIF